MQARKRSWGVIGRYSASGAPGVTATASLNTIRVEGATSSPTLLRWHFDPRFVSDPPLLIRAVESPYSPVGFIEVDNGAITEFVLRFQG